MGRGSRVGRLFARLSSSWGLGAVLFGGVGGVGVCGWSGCMLGVCVGGVHVSSLGPALLCLVCEVWCVCCVAHITAIML
jgi:hypothetical protein